MPATPMSLATGATVPPQAMTLPPPATIAMSTRPACRARAPVTPATPMSTWTVPSVSCIQAPAAGRAARPVLTVIPTRRAPAALAHATPDTPITLGTGRTAILRGRTECCLGTTPSLQMLMYPSLSTRPKIGTHPGSSGDRPNLARTIEIFENEVGLGGRFPEQIFIF